jgi:hypothetical protein
MAAWTVDVPDPEGDLAAAVLAVGDRELERLRARLDERNRMPSPSTRAARNSSRSFAACEPPCTSPTIGTSPTGSAST